MTGHLTVDRIAKAAPLPHRYVLYDTEIPGFGVRVTPHGAKSYVFRYRTKAGTQRWATWKLSELTLDKARDRARVYLGVVAAGDDPLRRVDLARTAPTLGDIADRFLKEHVAVRLKPSTERNYRQLIDTHIRPHLGTLAIADVAKADVVRLQHRLRPIPIQANRTLATLSKLLNWAEQVGLREQRSNPCYGVHRYKEHARRRYLTPAEFQHVGVALRRAERGFTVFDRQTDRPAHDDDGHELRRYPMSPIALTAIRLLLLTGARVGEILSLRWREVDLARAALHLTDSKTGRKTILLNAPALAILEAWPRHAKSPYVFPGEGRREGRKGDHRVDIRDAWAWIRKRARIADVRLHDLRHSFASIAVSSGQTLPIVGALLGHTQAATTQRYAHLMDDPLRAAAEATGARIAAAIAPRRR
jgi:integrase